jgi:hypothetical protein
MHSVVVVVAGDGFISYREFLALVDPTYKL